MDFANTWFIIDRNKQHEVISYEDLVKLESHSYTLLQNFKSHQDAMAEMSQLVKQNITATNQKINHVKSEH
jgi:hypothetical protein